MANELTLLCAVCHFPARLDIERRHPSLPVCSATCLDATTDYGCIDGQKQALIIYGPNPPEPIAKRKGFTGLDKLQAACAETAKGRALARIGLAMAQFAPEGTTKADIDRAIERDREAQACFHVRPCKGACPLVAANGWKLPTPEPRRAEPLRYPAPGKDISGNAIIIEEWHLPADPAKGSPRVMIGVDPAYENDTTMFVTHTRHEGGIVRIPTMTAQQQADYIREPWPKHGVEKHREDQERERSYTGLTRSEAKLLD